MAEKRSKLMGLLEAYEEMTRKETICLREENWEALLKTQEKKGRVAERIRSLNEEPLSPEAQSDFNTRIDVLKKRESQNAETLSEMLKENRDLHKRITRSTRSGSKALRAYGQPNTTTSRINTLTDKA